jgi:hypothetical protein
MIQLLMYLYYNGFNENIRNFLYSRTVQHLHIIRFIFIYQLMHKRVALNKY